MEHILSLSYGKDSLACLGAIEELGWPIDRIVHAEVWATDTIPADQPPMMEFKAKADTIIKERWGIEVEHTRAKKTYEDIFYSVCGEQGRPSKEERNGAIYGWPYRSGPWCNSRLKQSVLSKIGRRFVQYIGITADEPERIEKYKAKHNVKLPLVEAEWTEVMCWEWCEKNGLLSPIYKTSTRGGCWFCHNQGADQLRLLRRNYQEYWTLMLKWDKDSPVTFHADGHTVHDYERRFQAEDLGLVPTDRRFRWWDVLEQVNICDCMKCE